MLDPIVRVVWCLSQNMGDTISYWLLRQAGYRPVLIQQNDPGHKYVVCGSILNWCKAPCTAWGPGLAYPDHNVDPDTEILAVRGPLSRDIAIKCGAKCPDIYGDPGLLMPYLYHPYTIKKYQIGLIGHFLDQEEIYRHWDNPDFKIIDSLAPIEKVIDEMLSCEIIISSCLHGLILADAYKIPNVWVRVPNVFRNDDMKFHDYLLSVNRDTQPLYLSRDIIPFLADAARRKLANINIKKFIKVCPFSQLKDLLRNDHE